MRFNINEQLQLVKYPEAKYPSKVGMKNTKEKHKGKTGLVVVRSDKPDKAAATKEIMMAANGAYGSGRKLPGLRILNNSVLTYDPDTTLWFAQYDDFDEAVRAINAANGALKQVKYMVNSVQSLESVLGQIENASFLRGKIDTFMEDLSNLESSEDLNNTMRNYMEFIKDFIGGPTKYSENNIALIRMAKPDATKVLTFHKWLKRGRIPIGTRMATAKGQGAIQTIQGLWEYGGSKTQTNPPPNDNLKAPEWYRLVLAYDISDTREATLGDYRGDRHAKAILSKNGGAIPQDEDDDSKDDWWEATIEDSPKIDKLFDLLRKMGDEMGIDSSGMNITPSSGHINVISKVRNNKAATLLHAMVHDMVHTEGGVFNYFDKGKFTSGHQEIQAEMVTFIVMRSFKIDVEHHPTVKMYKGKPELIEQDLKIAKRVGEKIVLKLKEIQKSERMNRSVDESLALVLAEIDNY